MRSCAIIILALLLVHVGLGWLAPAPGVVDQPLGAQGSPRTLLMEGVQIQSYGAGLRRLQVQAARAYASTRRWGFFQLGLVPTLELEDVVIEHTDAEGSPRRRHLSSAVIDWSTKLLDELPQSSSR